MKRLKALLHYATALQLVLQRLNPPRSNCTIKGCYTRQYSVQLVVKLPAKSSRKNRSFIFIGWSRLALRDKLHEGCYNVQRLKIRCSIAVIVVNFVQHLQQQKCCKTWWLRTMLQNTIHVAIGTCFTTKVQKKSQNKLHDVTAPVISLKDKLN